MAVSALLILTRASHTHLRYSPLNACISSTQALCPLPFGSEPHLPPLTPGNHRGLACSASPPLTICLCLDLAPYADGLQREGDAAPGPPQPLWATQAMGCALGSGPALAHDQLLSEPLSHLENGVVEPYDCKSPSCFYDIFVND